MPLVPPALCLATGIAAAPWVSPDSAWFVLAGALAWGASLVALGRRDPAAVCLLLGVAAAGALRAAELPLRTDHLARQGPPARAVLRGRLLAEPTRLAPDRARLLVEAEQLDGNPAVGRVLITAYGPELPPVTEGQRVEAPVQLHRAIGFRNPGGFDYAEALRRDDILVVGTTRSERLMPIDAPAPPWYVRARHTAAAAADRSLPSASAALLRGLLLGDRTDLPRDIDDAFRRAGVYHVLAVSGFNVALVGGAVWALLTLAHGGRRLAALGAMGAVVGFGIVAGPEASVLRAVVMGVLVLGAIILEREASLLNSLALAALVILTIHPGDLLDPGFQLSFAATGAIVLAPLPRGAVLGGLGVSLAAQLGVLPISLVHFNQLSTLGPIANLAVVPLAGAATILGLLGVSLAFVTETGADLVLNATWPLLLALRGIVAAAAAVPGAVLHLPAPHWTAVVTYTLGLGMALAWWRRRQTAPTSASWAGVAALALLAGAVGIAAWPLVRPADARLRVTVLDVGQGDAIVIEAPDGQALLIDAGPGGPMRLDTGERVVAPFLWNRGILRLAAAATTHDDRDHAGGMAAIQRHFTIGEKLSPGERTVGGASVRAFYPDDGPAPPIRRNDHALVVRLDYGSAAFLLASDIDGPAEARLLAAAAPLQATVLKVAHHGSRSSSTEAFLRRVQPAYAAVSVGARNPYGHPAAETVTRLTAAGARVYRTDRDGALLFETDGRSLWITRWASRQTERYCLDPDGVC